MNNTISKHCVTLARAIVPPQRSFFTRITTPTLLGLGLACSSSAGPLKLEIQPQGNEFEVTWTAVSLTPFSPYQHYDFDLQQSGDLVVWTNARPRVSGSSLSAFSQVLRERIPRAAGPAFFRLARSFNRAGADLRGMDFSGADLKGANLAGADFAGAILAGGQFSGANIQGVDLGNLSMVGVDLTGTVGAPEFKEVYGPADGLVSGFLPRLPRQPGPEEFSIQNSVFQAKAVAKQLAVLGLETNTTVGQLNALLANRGGSIVASIPGGAGSRLTVLLVRFPTPDSGALNELTKILESEPGVAVCVPDIQLSNDVVTDDLNAANDPGGWSWDWDAPPAATGGNWGLEYARVPQMWNYGESIIKSHGSSVSTLVVDAGFPAHPDLSINVLNPGVAGSAGWHGVHVAGIVAASYGNNSGIDGVNPFTKLNGYTFGGSAWGDRDGIAAALALAPDTRIISMSYGFGWTQDGVKTLTAKELAEAWRYATNYGKLCYDLATNTPGLLFVCSAGNDYQGVPASINSAWAAAGLIHGAPNVLVVESQDPGGALAAMSNVGGGIAAPGGQILSLAPGGGYAVLSGTSMATPFVSGLAGFLWAADPNLSVSQVIGLLRPSGFGSPVDAFESLIGIDALRSPTQAILKGLLDIDDGTADGATRVEVPVFSTLGDRNFLRISGSDFTDLDVDGDGGLGNGKIDMGDFRMWRDWLLYGEEAVNLNYSLNGSDANPKFDANQDGKREASREITVYPRGDFNGDGKMDRIATRNFKGVPITDLEVLMTSGLWQDEDVEVSDLPGLVDTVDLIVSAAGLFEKEPEFPGGEVHLIDAKTGAKLDSMFKQPLTFTREKPIRILTVPVGKSYFLSSDSIPLSAGAKAAMRSIGSLTFGTADRGGDFAADLTHGEMTARFSRENPSEARVDSDPKGRVVVAILDSALDAEPQGNAPQAYADDQANLYAWAKSYPDDDAPKDKQTLFTAQVNWQRAFTKLPNVADPTYHIKPIRLRLSDHDTATNELTAYATIRIERRVGPATNAAWQTVFFSSTTLAGRGDPGSANTFRIVEHLGPHPQPMPVFEDTATLGRVAMQVEIPDFYGRISLSDIAEGASFEVRYSLKAEVLGPLNEFNPCDGDCVAEAYVGDPLSYGSGISMRYGDFGGLFEFQGYSVGQGGDAVIPYSSGTNFYFVLFQTNDVTHVETPIAIQMGVVGNGAFVVKSTTPGTTVEDFRLLAVPLERPVDVDGDGIDDLYEFNRPTILDPLDPNDAAVDADGDGYTNLAEYQNGTDPLVKDQPPLQGVGLYPGLAQSSSVQALLRVSDVNRDQIPDLISLGGEHSGLVVSLGNPDGTFQLPVETPVSWYVGFATDLTVAKLDGDDVPDVVVTALVDNKAYLFRGVEDGRFQPMAELPTGTNPRRVVALKLNGDVLNDLAILNERSKSISLFVNQGSTNFSALTEVSLSSFGLALDLAAGDLNGDGVVDLVASANIDKVAVLLGVGDGSFQPMKTFIVDVFPDHIAVGDLDGDGRLDIVTSSGSQSTISVLYNIGSGSFASEQRRVVPPAPLGMTVRDLNGDGRGSVIIGHRSAVTTVLDGQADRSLDTLSYLALNSGDFPALADFDGDSQLDLLNTATGVQSIHRGDTNGTFDAGRVCFNTNTAWTHMNEVVAPVGVGARWVGLEQETGSLQVIEATGPESCSVVRSVLVGPNPEWLSLGDVTGDGILDALIATYEYSFGGQKRGTNQIVILQGDASGGYGNLSYVPLSGAPLQVQAGDVNGDGRKDLLVLTQVPYQLVLYLQEVGGTWARQAPIEMFASTLQVSDLDLNGTAEVLIGQYGANAMVYGWNGNALTLKQSVANTDFATAWTLVDYDGDGDLDLLMSLADPDVPSVVLCIGTAGSFGAPQTLVSGALAGAILFDDVTGDGRKDLILDDLGTTVAIYPAKAGGGFDSRQLYILAESESSKAESARAFIRDLTGDGRPELIRVGGSSIRTLVHR
jgi:subtilisin family serine protease